MLHPVGGSHALAREAVGPGLPGPFLPGGQLAGFNLDAEHSPQAAKFGLCFQGLNPPLRLGDGVLLYGVLLLGNDRQQGFSGGGVQVRVRVPCCRFTITANLLAFALSASFGQFTSSSLNCY